MEPNGEASTSPFNGVALAVDAYTLDAATGKRRLKAIDPDGVLEYDEPKHPRAKRTEALERIWNEYPNGLLDLTEETLRTADPRTEYGVEKEDEQGVTADQREKGELMAADDMEALRSEVYSNLNEARNELWFILELAKTLAASAGMSSDPSPEPIPSAPQPKKGKQQQQGKGAAAQPSGVGSLSTPSTAAEAEAPILPAGTFSTTPGAAPTRNAVETAKDLELALAARQRALDDCAALIDAAVDELQLMNKASEQWSTDVRELRRGGDDGRGQWAVVPKPDFARTGANAKDLVIPYALDEAPAALHSRSLVAFDLDPRKADTLSFGARSFHRLRVLYRVGGSGGDHRTSTPYRADAEGGIRATIEAAQLETIDEDLFNELRTEAARIDSLIEPQSISLLVGRNKLTFQLYDTREAPSPNAEQSPLCDAVLAAARLGLLHLYQRRKQRLIEPAPPAAPTAVGPGGQQANPPSAPPAQSNILLPLVHMFQFHAACSGVRPALSGFAATLSSAGLRAALVERHSADDNDAEVIYGLLAARAKVDVLGAVFSLELSGCPGVTVNITAPSSISVSTPRSTFPLRDLDAVSGIVGDVLASQLSRYAYNTALATAANDEASGIFFDELDGVVIAGSLGALDISIPAPYTALCASVAGDAVAPYNSQESAQTWTEWLSDLARAVPREEVM